MGDNEKAESKSEDKIIEIGAIYMVAYFRAYPPGDPFHWGLYIKTYDHPRGTLFHVTKNQAKNPGWVYIPKSQNFVEYFTSVLAAKLGYVPDGTTCQDLHALFAQVPVGGSSRYSGDWRCNVWVRDATHLLVSLGWIQCENVDALWMNVRSSALLIRDEVTTGLRGAQIITAPDSR